MFCLIWEDYSLGHTIRQILETLTREQSDLYNKINSNPINTHMLIDTHQIAVRMLA